MGTLSIIGTGSYLPQRRIHLTDAADRHPADSERILATGYHSVCVEETLYPADMALIAARRALSAADRDPADITLLVVTAIHRHGHKRLWSPASWLQSQLGSPRALPLTVNQGCNGQMLALELAQGYLSGTPGGTALIVATDQFSSSSFNRFTADYGIAYGDAAAAAILTSTAGSATDDGSGAQGAGRGWRILATHTVAAPDLEGLHRADAPAPETPETLHTEHDVRAAKKRFLTENGAERLQHTTRAAVREIRQQLLPGSDHPRLRRIVYPNLGLQLLRDNYFPEFPGGADTSLWDFGRTVGHLGSGDQIAGLDHLTTQQDFTPGDRLLLLGAGAGFTWTGTLLERN
ncbi:ketoacyl-ACP synthase III family protein [Kitasatospora mediocidica]|uniref:ketoacyl-ACP synthase III family protein n=1 Tax=Kitasatospora mediocidica TaxID=58352 RepID=UPI000560519F|nr:ketoacyl-ACP synthase III family protein [Kitasatospora mediocidica]